MGLDMSLTKRTYVKNWKHYAPEEINEITIKKGGKDHPDIKIERVTFIVEDVAYWRKFNALHQWFVDNCQDGMDECQESIVEQKKLVEILNILLEIKESHDTGDMAKTIELAQNSLPTQQGFFYGSTDYDEYYFDDVFKTIEIFESLINEGGEFYYQASW